VQLFSENMITAPVQKICDRDHISHESSWLTNSLRDSGSFAVVSIVGTGPPGHAADGHMPVFELDFRTVALPPG
jgi:hypothetical protein